MTHFWDDEYPLLMLRVDATKSQNYYLVRTPLDLTMNREQYFQAGSITYIWTLRDFYTSRKADMIVRGAGASDEN